MSNNLMDIAVCCLSCANCFQTLDIEHQKEDRKVESKEDRKENIEIKYKKMEDICPARIIVDYTFEDKRCLKNEKGEVFCGYCKKTINDHMISLLQCGECKRYVGHPICYVRANKKCILCK